VPPIMVPPIMVPAIVLHYTMLYSIKLPFITLPSITLRSTKLPESGRGYKGHTTRLYTKGTGGQDIDLNTTSLRRSRIATPETCSSACYRVFVSSRSACFEK